jgi:RNA polymerase sigma factor (sigma-70 family)
MDLDANRSLIAGALGRIPDGDRAALQTVYRLTSAKLFGVCLRILGEHGEAEDVLQEVYVTVWRKAADFDARRASPMTWLIAIARNRAIDRLRASRRSRNMEAIDAATDVADSAAGADRRIGEPARARKTARLS